MHSSIDELFDGLWQDYIAITPSAAKIHQLLGNQSGQSDIINDHIALRTFNIEKVNLEKLAAHFIHLGYEAKGDYEFVEKKLRAKHFEHADLSKPKVFISELLVEAMPEEVQSIIQNMVAQMDSTAVLNKDFLYSGTHWQVSSEEYDSLLEHSEYAAWMSAWGYRANHFTVSVNYLNKFSSLEEVNETLKNAGFILNSAGGEIKGGPEVYLAQSATMADKASVSFSDGNRQIPSCFYEFAERFSLPSGSLYQGFVAASADKIFESTNASQ